MIKQCNENSGYNLYECSIEYITMTVLLEYLDLLQVQVAEKWSSTMQGTMSP